MVHCGIYLRNIYHMGTMKCYITFEYSNLSLHYAGSVLIGMAYHILANLNSYQLYQYVALKYGIEKQFRYMHFSLLL